MVRVTQLTNTIYPSDPPTLMHRSVAVYFASHNVAPVEQHKKTEASQTEDEVGRRNGKSHSRNTVLRMWDRVPFVH